MRVEGDCASSFVRAWPKSLRRGAISGPKTLRHTPRKGAFDLKLARHQIIMLCRHDFRHIRDRAEPNPGHARPAFHHDGNERRCGNGAMAHHGLHPGQRHHDSHYRLPSDRYSTRNLFTVSMLIFTAGSALSGWSPNFPVLLAGRLLQAAGAGILMPMVMTVLMLTFPPERRGSAMDCSASSSHSRPPLASSAAGFVIDVTQLARAVLDCGGAFGGGQSAPGSR